MTFSSIKETQEFIASSSLFIKNPWAGQLASILPLSALIEFAGIPRKLHVLELIGAVPLWNWPVTPAGNRLLLPNGLSDQSCSLDRVGSSVPITCIDGRYGDSYPCSIPETVRLCLSTKQCKTLENKHSNILVEESPDDRKRIQRLEIVHVFQPHPKTNYGDPKGSWLGMVPNPWPSRSPNYLIVSLVGWLLWCVFTITSSLLGFYIAGVYLVLIPSTGLLVSLIHGSKPRQLLVNKGTDYKRMVIATENVNGADWMVFYGPSTIVNSLLNRPLYRKEPTHSHVVQRLLRVLLRAFIFGQWAMAIASACLQDWNAYIISFWVILCIVSQSYFYNATQAVKDWLKFDINLRLDRYEVTLSSRRALLTAILALNPDTFDPDQGNASNESRGFREGGVKWIDHILAKGPSRHSWQMATCYAMRSDKGEEVEEDASEKSSEWMKEYWYKYIDEGIKVAKMIKMETHLDEPEVQTD